MQQQLVAYATACVKPALDYYAQHLAAEAMSRPLSAFKAARLFSPRKLQEINPSCSDVDSLSAFPFFQPPPVTALKNEFPQCIAAAEDVCSEYSPLDFWKNHETTLPAWGEAANKVLSVQPSSAAAERIFSLLKCNVGEQQLSALEDYIETWLTLQYNKR